jgi:acetylornithine deacetylase
MKFIKRAESKVHYNMIMNKLKENMCGTRKEMLDLLRNSIRIPSVSGEEIAFVEFIHAWAKDNGFKTDLFEIEPANLEKLFIFSPRHIPLSGRPALVIIWPGCGNGPSLIFNAHADTVPIGEANDWSLDPFSGKYKNGKVYGRGSCDAKGPLISALWAMHRIKQEYPEGLAGDVMLELIPGEEDCVGLGTLGSINRGYNADAAIILEPTENVPCSASRGGIRFVISCKGKSVHGTAKWLGKDAIASMRKVLTVLDELQDKWNDRAANKLFDIFPIIRPITVDKINGGRWQGMVCDRCSCEGYLELLPEDDLREWQNLFLVELRNALGDEEIEIEFTENYPGHNTSLDTALSRKISSTMEDVSGSNHDWNNWSVFNSGCESGVRAKLHDTPTIIWGPGSIENAHSTDEFVEFGSVETCAELLMKTAVSWSNNIN